jgi:26S proteasome regulatory subunit T6
MLREELQLLQEQGSYVGEVVKPMDKKKVLVKVNAPFLFSWLLFFH